jgi:hypothetical protein
MMVMLSQVEVNMMNKNEIIVVKNKDKIIIAFNGCKLIKPIDKFKDLSEEEIKIWFIKEMEMESEVT